MKTQMKIFLMGLMLVPSMLSAQWLTSPAQRMVFESIKDALFVSEQGYLLRDTLGNNYGRDGRNEFSKTYELGISLQDGIFVPESCIAPWKHDSSFVSYSEAYEPRLTQRQVRAWADTTFHPIQLFDDSIVAYGDSMAYVAHGVSTGRQGLAVDNTTGDKEGWLVLVYAKGDVSSANSLDYLVFNKNITVTDSQSFYEITFPALSDGESVLLGGFYVTPSFPKNGVIEFKVTGMMVQKDRQWLLCAPFALAEPVTHSETDAHHGESQLTPINNEPSQPAEDNDGGGRRQRRRRNN